MVSEAVADPAVTRLIIAPPADGPANPDVFFSQAVGVLMRHERLDVEVAYVAPRATRATRNYGLPHGAAARVLAEDGAAQTLPLIRDDAGTVLVGYARHLGRPGEDGKPTTLHGETYVDSERLFDGDVRGIVIEPIPDLPGVRGRRERLLPGGWLTGRAVQTGGIDLVVEREGVLTPRVVKRSCYYRHHLDWKLVRP
ncbi:MAG: hypothetical protein QM809_02090 [Gordonia sp. (in: high G+C Gram-positive bacteria)]|uniref:hypothetical protein n=1 Tax=Gordonia sp. (in: high G+C Gram-positive bacteria) TaxID=84139 RepID=UPI0039E487B9